MALNDDARSIAAKIATTQDTFDLHDRQVIEIAEVMAPLVKKWGHRSNTEDNLIEFEKEVVGRLADKGYLAHVDLYDCWVGQGPPIVEIVGNISSNLYKYGLDHEEKGWEVNDANRRGEKVRGQKGKPKGKAK